MIEEEYNNQQNQQKQEQGQDNLNCNVPQNKYTPKCNKLLLEMENKDRKEQEDTPQENILYPTLNDPNFNKKISLKKEFYETRYDGTIHKNIEEYTEVLGNADFELSPHQIFVKNFLSIQTPYKSILLYHGLGTGKTCSAIGICEEYRDYMKKAGITKKILIVASPIVQDNFRLQLFDERKLKQTEDGGWIIKSCIGNKLLKEINPTGNKGLNREKIIKQIDILINKYYLFIGYIEFANYIDKVESPKITNVNLSEKSKVKNLQIEFNNSFIVIDEVHNIRYADENKNKRVGERLTRLISTAENIRLVLLSATPMYNSYKEIIWLISLMNLNDRRGIINTNDIFDKDGNLKVDENGNEIGKELLIRKITGYVSFVRGENPYLFPFRIYPSEFIPERTFDKIKYPKYQMNEKKTTSIKFLSLYLSKIGSHQSVGYNYIIEKLKNTIPNFFELNTFKYTDLQLPLEALNIIYPFGENGEEDIIENEFSTVIKDNETNELIGGSTNNDDDEDDEEDEDDDGDEDDISTVSITTQTNLDEKDTNDITELLKSLSSNLSTTSTTSTSTSTSKTLFTPKETQTSTPREIFKDREFVDMVGLVGKTGLKNTMEFEENDNVKLKGKFKYRPEVLEKYGRIFSKDQIGKYSSKIKSICDCIVSPSGKVSEGIILIYSQYIDAGIIPMALALEEMGISRYGNTPSLFSEKIQPVDVKTMKPRENSEQNFQPAKYIMITGDPKISPNNEAEINASTNINNINGEKIKVILISKAGSEGIDFKYIRQIHILEPWYNMNRIEQVIGRGVRNMSHKDLPFEKRNVQIFLHGTILQNQHEEAIDVYLYRIAELKAIQIGKISRILKENAIDCFINQEQMNFTQKNMKRELEGIEINQILSTGETIYNYEVGDRPYSSICDYMETCNYKCQSTGVSTTETAITTTNKKENINTDTYNEFFIKNNEKLIYKIKLLMKERHFYTKNELIKLINIPKPYPLEQIYYALTEIINDKYDFIYDSFGRPGFLVNSGEYYFFQPYELRNNEKPSFFDIENPIDYKNKNIIVDAKEDIYEKINRQFQDVELHPPSQQLYTKSKNTTQHIEEDEQEPKGKFRQLKQSKIKILLEDIYDKYNTSKNTNNVKRGEKDYYKHIGLLLNYMNEKFNIDDETLDKILIDNILDFMLYDDKKELLYYFFNTNGEGSNKHIDVLIRDYFLQKLLISKSDPTIRGIFMYNNDTKKIEIFTQNEDGKFQHSTEQYVLNKLVEMIRINKQDLPSIIGFMIYNDKTRENLFKTKDTSNTRNEGAICIQAGKNNNIATLNKIVKQITQDETLLFDKENTKHIVNMDMCVFQYFLLKYLNFNKKNNKKWFMTLEETLINDIHKATK